ncbi:MAG: restriction endonuclease subunit S [Oscillospiraceae bacterium]|nr:restriction endonuclease subunit S [Oscillospiraceae bacterium]
MFEIQTYKKRFDANKVNVLQSGKFPYIVRMGNNNGQKGFLDEDEVFLNEGNTISFGQDTATMFYQETPYFTGDKIKILKCKYKRFSKKNAQFFIAMMQKSFSSFSWGSSSFSVKIVSEQVVNLPITTDNKIDFDFMESFLSELEAERISELEAYLTATGLKDYNLTAEEEKALADFENNKIEFAEFTYQSIFNKIVQGRRLKKEDQLKGNIPFVMAGTTNTGVVNYISNPVASFPSNSITIDIFGNTFYRNYAFGAGDDTGVYWNDKHRYSKEMMLFLATAMEKSISGKYSYGKKLRSSQSFDFKMNLPVSNSKPDYDAMATLISAVQKLVIRDVVLYADRNAKATKQVADNN